MLIVAISLIGLVSCQLKLDLEIGASHLAQNTNETAAVDLQDLMNTLTTVTVYVGKDSEARKLIVDTSSPVTWLPNKDSEFITQAGLADRKGFDCSESETCERSEISPNDLNIYYGKGHVSGYIETDLFKLDGVESDPVSLKFLESTKNKEFGSISFDGVLGLGCETFGAETFKESPVQLFNDTLVDVIAKQNNWTSMFSVNLNHREGKTQVGGLLIGGWHTDIVASESMINWYPIADKFVLDVEYFGLGLNEVMVNYQRRIFL